MFTYLIANSEWKVTFLIYLNKTKLRKTSATRRIVMIIRRGFKKKSSLTRSAGTLEYFFERVTSTYNTLTKATTS